MEQSPCNKSGRKDYLVRGGEKMDYKKFEQLLKRDGVTVYRVSQATGIPQSTLSDWKKGKSSPKIDKVCKLAKHFDVPIEFFIEERSD